MTDATAATSVRPFRIEIPRADVGYPYDRLASARWPGELPGVAWARGVPADYLRELARGRRRRAGMGDNAPEGSDTDVVARNRRTVACRPLARFGPGRPA
jgi:hypothetical protein